MENLGNSKGKESVQLRKCDGGDEFGAIDVVFEAIFHFIIRPLPVYLFLTLCAFGLAHGVPEYADAFFAIFLPFYVVWFLIDLFMWRGEKKKIAMKGVSNG